MVSRFERIRRNDPVFGRMTFMKGGRGYWEGTAHFIPTNSKVEVMVDGASDDSFSEQHEIFDKISQTWPEIVPKIMDAIAFAFPDHSRGFIISSLSIPKSRCLEDAEWDVMFETPSTGYFYTAVMKGAEVLRIDWDS